MTVEPLRLHVDQPPANDSSPEAVALVKPAVAKRLIRLRDLFDLIDVSKPTGHRLLAAGKIGPRPIRFSSSCVRFDVEEVNAWISTRKPDGSLHDSKSWQPVWEALQRRKRS